MNDVIENTKTIASLVLPNANDLGLINKYGFLNYIAVFVIKFVLITIVIWIIFNKIGNLDIRFSMKPKKKK